MTMVMSVMVIVPINISNVKKSKSFNGRKIKIQ
jgi:hypothetical protein